MHRSVNGAAGAQNSSAKPCFKNSWRQTLGYQPGWCHPCLQELEGPEKRSQMPPGRWDFMQKSCSYL